ncbi:MAG: Rab family GTPase [Candidatus Hodarchaeota archaeon]
MDLFEGNQEQLYKVCLVGDGGVGKSAILERFFGIEERFQWHYKPTIGAEIAVKSIIIDETEIKLQIWDIAGQPQFEFVRAGFYKGSCAMIMVFDLTAPQTLYHLNKWKNEVMANISRTIPFLVVGNKDDLQSAIDYEEIRSFIEKFKHETPSMSLPFLFASALTGHNIKEVFETLGRSILEYYNVQNLYNLQATV